MPTPGTTLGAVRGRRRETRHASADDAGCGVHAGRRIAVLALASASVVLAACGSTSPTSTTASSAASSADTPGTTLVAAGERGTRTWVGTVDGTDAFLAVLVGADGRALAYLCDGEELVQYLDGRLDDEALTAEDGDGTTLAATVTDDAVTGTTTLADGSVHTFVAPAATGPAGLWWLDEDLDDGVRVGGWIRTADGAWRGKSGDVVIVGRKIDGGTAGAGRTTTTSTPSGTVLINGCPLSVKGSSDVTVKGGKIDDGSGSGNVAIEGGKIADEVQPTSTRNGTSNQPPPTNASRTTDVDQVRCALVLKPELSIVIKGSKVRQN